MKHHINEVAARFLRTVYRNTSVKDEWTKLHSSSLGRYTKKQLTSMLLDEFHEYHFQELNGHIDNFCSRFSSDTLDFFDVLLDFSRNMITRYDDRFCFKYQFTDIWRMITKEIGEEIFVTAAVLQNDYQRRFLNRQKMDWSYCIEHDNHELHQMLRRDVGVSENHFHLRGSSPYFDISWIYLMNDLSNSRYESMLDEMEQEVLNQFPGKKSEYPLKVIWRKAAAIRLFLHLFITRRTNPEVEDLYQKIIGQVLPYNSNVICTFPINDIQSMCNTVNHIGSLDYAQMFSKKPRQKYYALCGERTLLYHCLRVIMMREEEYKIVTQMLFLYLMLKHRFYSEFVQSNERIGFYNFNQYQSRKDGIIPWQDELMVATNTICSVIENNHIYRAELRITPQLAAKETAEAIQIYDTAICKALSCVQNRYGAECEKNFFYTMHFVKRPEAYQNGFCRHQKLRQENHIKAHELLVLNYYDLNAAKRIYGIDASGAEMDCRPEVFAPVFRYLQNYDPHTTMPDGESFRQLKATFHVGEDNYDIADGLRAIDEAVNYLSLRSGCRLGHATMLGILPKEFYVVKNPVSMPSQIFLDNVVWMYFFIRENSIHFDDVSHLLSYLKEKFEWYFHRIYADAINSANVIECCAEASKHGYSSINMPIRRENFKFDIYHYYLSYLLRGDEPDLYRNGYLSGNILGSNGYKVCYAKSEMQEARANFEASYLYYLYHYSESVNQKGLESVHEKLPEYFVQGVELIQKKMRSNLCFDGIAIETNPTSNLFISIIDGYAKHPITCFYDNALRKIPGEVQLNVSINTDDKSVFSTCLSNEYAYLMFNLEQEKDENGNPLYTRFEIMQWLDEIRKMGNEQSFAN